MPQRKAVFQNSILNFDRQGKPAGLGGPTHMSHIDSSLLQKVLHLYSNYTPTRARQGTRHCHFPPAISSSCCKVVLHINGNQVLLGIRRFGLRNRKPLQPSAVVGGGRGGRAWCASHFDRCCFPSHSSMSCGLSVKAFV